MAKRLTIDRAGRVVIPKPLRDALGLGPGDSLIAEGTDQQITLRPAHEISPMRKEHGHWVYRTGRPLKISIVDLIDKVREERDLRNM